MIPVSYTHLDVYKRQRLLHRDDIHHTLEGQLIEVETVAHIVVGRDVYKRQPLKPSK